MSRATREFLPLSDAAVRAVGGPNSRHAALIDDAFHSDRNAYVETLKTLRGLPVRVVHGGHFPSFGRDRFIELIDAHLSKDALCARQ